MLKHTLSEDLAQINEENKILKTVKQITDLQKIYDENIELIKNTRNKNFPLRFKISMLLYETVSKKLIKKGII